MARTTYSRNNYVGGGSPSTLSSDPSTGLTLNVNGPLTGWGNLSTGNFFAVLSYGLSNEEKVYIPAGSYSWDTVGVITINNVLRGVDGTTAVAHGEPNPTIRPCLTATDLNEANYVVSETVGQITTAGDLLVGNGANSLARLPVSSGFLQSTGGTPTWGPVSVSASNLTAGTLIGAVVVPVANIPLGATQGAYTNQTLTNTTLTSITGAAVSIATGAKYKITLEFEYGATVSSATLYVKLLNGVTQVGTTRTVSAINGNTYSMTAIYISTGNTLGTSVTFTPQFQLGATATVVLSNVLLTVEATN